MLTVLNGDCREVLKTLSDESVHCVITSPPYWGLRDYGTAQWKGGDPECKHNPQSPDGGQRADRTLPLGRGGLYRDTCGKCGAIRIDSQLGLEPTPEEYIATMVAVFREVRRVLRSDGTLWLNIGDSYANTGGMTGGTNSKENGKRADRMFTGAYRALSGDLKQKDLIGIPWALAFALRADGWYLRSEIIWAKPNPMPESVTDRPTKAHEQVFLLAKSARYFYDAEAIREGVTGNAHSRGNGINPKCAEPGNGIKQNSSFSGAVNELVSVRNRRTVWTIATAPYSDAHFATFPPKLVEPCVLAGTSARGCCAECGAPWERVVASEAVDKEGWGAARKDHTGNISGSQSMIRDGNGRAGSVITTTTGWQPTCTHLDADVVPCSVLDPFAGSGTVGKVALQLGRRAVLIELNADYCRMIERRNQVTLGLPGLA